MKKKLLQVELEAEEGISNIEKELVIKIITLKKIERRDEFKEDSSQYEAEEEVGAKKVQERKCRALVEGTTK